MSLAIGGSAAPGRPAHGDLWVDVRDFGAKADNGATDNAGPIQAAIDALGAKLNYNNTPYGMKGVVYIPSASGTYVVNKTIWVDSPNIEIQGDGWGSQVQMNPSLKHSVFLFGLRRVESATVNGATVPVQIDAAHRPDLFGKLDSSVVTGPGQRWGIRTNGDSFVQVQASPMSSGPMSAAGGYTSDYWSETTKLTVEFCIEPPDGGGFPLNTPLVAMGNTYYQPSPFTVSVWDDPKKIIVSFQTSDIGPVYGAGPRAFAFLLNGATPPYRIAFQIDLDNAACSVFVNGVQTSIIYTYNLTPTSPFPFAPNTGLRFQQNDYFPLMIGADNIRGPVLTTTPGIDLRLYGLRFSKTIRYRNLGAGQPQTRADAPAAPINDLYAYFTKDGATIGYFALTDNPSTAGRVVSIQHGNTASTGGVGSGLFLQHANGNNLVGNAIRNLSVVAGLGHGQAISIASVYELTLENVRAVNGFHGVGSFNTFTNYIIYINKCTLQGFDSAYYGALQTVHGSDIYCLQSGKATIRLLGSNGNWRNIFISYASPVAECFVKLHSSEAGGNHSFENLQADFEGDTLTQAAIYCEANAHTPATSLLLKDILLGTVGSKTALVMLKDLGTLGGSYNRCWLSVNNLQAFTNDYLAAIDVDGPLWHGEVRGVALGGPQFNHRQKYGTNTNIIIRDTKYVAPPRKYPWYAGAHALEVRSPADGQFSEWRCVASGSYGTANPPKWIGLNPLSLSTNGLAAYILNYAFITATLS